jgi:uncharacterized protein YvpB
MVITRINPLLQMDYGESLDCTLTSITTVISFLKPNREPKEIYDIVEKHAKKYFYNGEKYGTIPIFINSIYNASLKEVKSAASANTKYIKGLAYNLSTIQKSIDKYKPVILNIWRDSEGIYNNHTVVVIGYENDDLLIYDNWGKSVKRLKYSRIGRISSISVI